MKPPKLTTIGLLMILSAFASAIHGQDAISVDANGNVDIHETLTVKSTDRDAIITIRDNPAANDAILQFRETPGDETGFDFIYRGGTSNALEIRGIQNGTGAPTAISIERATGKTHIDSLQVTSHYTYPNAGNTGASAGWYLIGTWNTMQHGRTCVIRVEGGQGYNALWSQNSTARIHIRTSNGDSNLNGLYAHGTWHTFGGDLITNVAIKQISTSKYQVWAEFGRFSGHPFVKVECSRDTSFEQSTINEAPDTPLTKPEGCVELQGTLRLLNDFEIYGDTNIYGQVVARDDTDWVRLHVSDASSVSQVLFGDDAGDTLEIKFNHGTDSTQSKVITRFKSNGDVDFLGRVLQHGIEQWADHVFDADYVLPPIESVAEFIAANKHLPGVSSEQTIREKGLDMAEMMAAHMEKIEELTLYAIEANTERDQAQERVAALETRMAQLENRLELALKALEAAK